MRSSASRFGGGSCRGSGRRLLGNGAASTTAAFLRATLPLRRARNDIGAGRAHGVDIHQDAGVAALVNAGDTIGLGGQGVPAADDLDLGALHVELGAAAAGRPVEGDHLGPEEVFPVWDARGDVDVVEAAVGDDR